MLPQIPISNVNQQYQLIFNFLQLYTKILLFMPPVYCRIR